MPLVTFKQEDQLGEIVIDNPPLNLFNADVLSDCDRQSTRQRTATYGPCWCEPRVAASPPELTSRSSQT